MTKYIIHYTDNGAINANAGSNSVDISDLNDGEMYTVTVEARSEYLSGESEPITITLGRSNSMNIVLIMIICISSSHSATSRYSSNECDR